MTTGVAGGATRPTVATLTALLVASSAHAAPDAAEAAAAAATEPTQLGQVVVQDTKAQQQVSSPKFTQPLRDTAQTVVVIPQEVYSQQGAATLSDVLRNTPGITFAAGEGGSASGTSGDAFYLRGFDTSNNVFIDGVRDVGAYSRDVYNIEQVEIAKGPAGSDIGRGGSGGYVNLVTKTPHQEKFIAGTLSYGFDDATSGTRKRATLDVNETIDSRTLKGAAFRLNAMVQDSDVVGRDTAKNKSWGIAPSLALGLGTDTRAIISYQHNKQDNIPDYGLPIPAFPGYTSTPASPSIPWTNFYGFTSDYDKVTADAYLARLEHDFSADLKVSNQTRYGENQREAVLTAPGSSATSYVAATGLLTRSRQGNKRNTENFSNQTNITAKLDTGVIHHDLSGGVEFINEKAYSPTFTALSLTPTLVTSTDPSAVVALPTRSGAYTDVQTDTQAAYLFDTLKLGSKWLLNGGLRAEHYKTKYLSVAADGTPTRIQKSDDLLSWKTGLVFKPVTAGSIYAAYAVSFKPPGSDFTLSSAVGNQNNPDADPQKTINVELGVKWDFFKGRLSTTLAGFHTENNKTVYTDPVLGAIPAGKQTVEGVEAGVTGKITEAWLVFGGISYLDTEYNSGTAAQTGASLPLTPHVTGSLWTSYKLPFGLVIGGGGQYRGAANRLDTTTTVPRTMPSFWVFNAMASYDLTKNITLRANVSNVFDKEYVQSFNNNGGRFVPGAPRAYLLSADFKF